MSNPWTGAIAEFPNVAVDCFTRPAALYVLTHAHTDHLAGLDSPNFNGRVHCHHTTKRILATLPRYRHLGARIVGHHYNQQFTGIVDGAAVGITLIALDHCPGSAMALIEGAHGDAVLVTGDIKAEAWWVESLRRNPILTGYRLGTRRLANVYFDLTFMYRGEPYLDLPPNADNIDALITLLSRYPMDDADVAFGVANAVLGADEVVAALAALFGGGVFTPHPQLGARTALAAADYHGAVAYAPVLAEAMAPSPTGRGPWFYLGAVPPAKFAVAIGLRIRLSAEEVAGDHLPLPLAQVPPRELQADLSVVDYTANGHRICRFRQRLWLWPQGASELLPQLVVACFSRHATYREIHHLISVLRPQQVFGCATFSGKLLKQLWILGGSMARLFGDVCRGSTFAYDTFMFHQYGRPSTHNKPPPLTVDRVTEATVANDDCALPPTQLFGFVGQQLHRRHHHRLHRPITTTTTSATSRVAHIHRINRGHSQICHYQLPHPRTTSHDDTTTNTTTSNTTNSDHGTLASNTSPLTSSSSAASPSSHSPTKPPRPWPSMITTTTVDIPRSRRPHLHRHYPTTAAKLRFRITNAMSYSQHVVRLCHIAFPPRELVDNTRIARIATTLRQDPTHWLMIKPRGII